MCTLSWVTILRISAWAAPLLIRYCRKQGIYFCPCVSPSLSLWNTFLCFISPFNYPFIIPFISLCTLSLHPYLSLTHAHTTSLTLSTIFVIGWRLMLVSSCEQLVVFFSSFIYFVLVCNLSRSVYVPLPFFPAIEGMSDTEAACIVQGSLIQHAVLFCCCSCLYVVCFFFSF